MVERVRFQLNEDDIPRAWLNPAAELTELAPILDPQTGAPLSRERLARSMPEALVDQELSTEPWFEIPEAVRQIYAQWRPTPLFRARRLERALNTPARIY
ncbi:MAG: hypothetical protein ACM30G_18515 [Micromonosporaceae bacterium]